MRLILVASLLLVATPTFAEDATKTMTLAVTADDLNILGQGLDLLPYGKVAPIIAKLHQQIVEQMHPKPPEASTKAEAGKK